MIQKTSALLLAIILIALTGCSATTSGGYSAAGADQYEQDNTYDGWKSR